MKKKNYLEPRSKVIEVTIERGVCQGSELTEQISDPFSGGSVPEEEDDWS
ncbi:MAG: hypothetical protein IKX26_01275 [Bacteroidales bacterium]|nr:hypothetical protein [Bacteroidales bacterium]MBR5398699.1 hypothetical protein [Bacteroidales bacterium]MBR6465460.1 hypothetical protein [Bacteroidales bacterium]